MRKFFLLFIGIGVVFSLSYGQAKCTIGGAVVDDDSKALAGAMVFLLPKNEITSTDSKGHYKFNNLQRGKYSIEISFLGYQTVYDTIIINDNVIFNAQLKAETLNLQEVVVANSYVENRKKSESLNLEIVDDKYLKQNLGGSLMGSLERLPGVSTIEIGSGNSKPVIRGLGFNRVVVAENGIKHEGQQWSSEHGLEIDQFAVNNIEIVKGPASLSYGSDAIGGVINMKNLNTPDKNSFGGVVDLIGKTNNDLVGTSISLYGRKERFFADFRATIIDYADYKVPTDSVDIYSYKAALYQNDVRNTAGNEVNLHTYLGFLTDNFSSRFYISNINSKNGFFANAHGLEPIKVDTLLHDKSNRDENYPYHLVNHFKVVNTTKYHWDDYSVEANLGYQNNYRQEWSNYVSHGYMPPVFPDTLSFSAELERAFNKHIYSANAKISTSKSDKTQYVFGGNIDYQNNKIDGRGFIIPAFKQITYGAYGIVKYNLSKQSILQAGVRYDYGNIVTDAYYDWYPSQVVDQKSDTTEVYLQRAADLTRHFSNFSWSVGYNYNTLNWQYKINVGKSFRMPIAKELAANGVNYHNFSFEVGNPNLSPEIAYQLDAGIEFNSKKIALGLTPFLNYFSNYIYLNPSAEHDYLYGNGNQVYYYSQSEVFRYGAEIHGHYELLKSVQIGVIGEYVYSLQLSGEKEGYTLPFAPPLSAIFNLKYHKHKLLFTSNAYFSVDYRVTAPQNNIVPPEQTTNGYQLINLGFGGTLKLSKQDINISMQVQNLLNTKYFNHTNYYRLINLPEAGRNFILSISIPFSNNNKSF